MASTRTGSKRLLRDLNQSIVFNLIVGQQAISRTDLAKKSRLPAATITRIVNGFLAVGLVSEVTSEESSGGRRPVLLSINAAAGYTVGIKLRENGMTVVVCDLSCTPIHTCEYPLDSWNEPHRTVDAISEMVKHCVAEAGLAMRQVLGVGIGVTGFIDSERGVCRYSSILNWQNIELGPALEFKLHVPVRVDNDVNTLAISEHLFGVGRKIDNFLLITVGRGIGLAIVVGGEIYRGAHGGAGEFGHTTLDLSADAPLCNCGRRGCLEAIASDYGILRAVTGEDPGMQVRDSIGELIVRAQNGDQAIQAVFQHASHALGIAIANMINIFDPARVLIGGEGLRAGDLLLDSLRSTISHYVFGERNDVDLVFCPIDEKNWARGAASLILHEVSQPPIYEGEEAIVLDDLLSQAASSKQQRRRRV